MVTILLSDRKTIVIAYKHLTDTAKNITVIDCEFMQIQIDHIESFEKLF